MKPILAVTFALSGALLTTGCATKKWVRQQTTPIQAKVDQVGEQTTQQGQALEQTKGQLSTDIKGVDERAQSGISAAQERASAAETRAGEAMSRAGEAMSRAEQANQGVAKNNEAINKVRGDLQQVVSNLDDYQPTGEAMVIFKFDSATLTEEAKQQLAQLVADRNALKRYFIAVQGYTDRTGSAQYNAALSRRRADAVVQYLVAQHDIPIYRVHMIGLGEQQPQDEGNTREARAKNRRVEVRIFSADAAAATLSQR
jgi:outer membrane protein OmpA-like peptidoglycan-associated protein